MYTYTVCYILDLAMKTLAGTTKTTTFIDLGSENIGRDKKSNKIQTSSTGAFVRIIRGLKLGLKL